MSKKDWNNEGAAAPVWRDGLSTFRSYAIMAAHQKAEGYSCVCMRPIGNANKIKFYPDLATWGMTNQDLEDMDFGNFRDRTDDPDTHYLRVIGTLESVHKLIDRLAATRNVAVITKDMVPDILNGKGKDLPSPHPTGVRIPLA